MAEQDQRSLVDLLRLEEVDRDIFRGRCHAGAPLRAFGGQVAAQALVAAGRTVDAERTVHSLHGYFLRPGRTTAPIVYLVDRTRDGGTFTTRRVTGVQHGEAIFTLSASFKAHEDGHEHQRRRPRAPEPEDLPSLLTTADATTPRPDGNSLVSYVLDLRYVPDQPDDADPCTSDGASRAMVWITSVAPLPDDPLLHVCALAYMSDMTLAGTAYKGHEHEPGRLQMASLDHAMWFHRPFRADEWLLFSTQSPSLADARGIALGEVHTRDGRLVASMVQEALLRVRKPRA
jgi:acyl-CoA thioesterase II